VSRRAARRTQGPAGGGASTGHTAAVEILRLVFVYAHLIGFALLLGGGAAQYLTGKIRINQTMLIGAITQLVTGVVLAAPIRDDPADEPDPAKLAVKAVIAIMIFVMAFFSRKREEVNRGHFLAIIGLTLVNAAVATFW
jgi:hypothetical protein